MHTALVSGWAGLMLLYELLVIDPTDPVYNPIWGQGSFVLPFASRLGVVTSAFNWSLDLGSSVKGSYWTYELVIAAHTILSGLLILASFWHWAYWDLDVFIQSTSRKVVLDLARIFGIHLLLASITCALFGSLHLTGSYGPGMWTSDSYGLLGSIRPVMPANSIQSLQPFSYGAIVSHHSFAGAIGLIAAL